MLYFFAAIDKWLGYDSPTSNDKGEWTRGHFVVKYAKHINFETFQSCMMVGEEGESLTEPELEICFEQCDDDSEGIKLLGVSSKSDTQAKYPEMLNLLQLDKNEVLAMDFGEDFVLNLLFKDSDLKFGNWKRSKAILELK
jgi:hypothetical protein